MQKNHLHFPIRCPPPQVPPSPGTPPSTQRCAKDQGVKGFPSLGNCKGLKPRSSEYGSRDLGTRPFLWVTAVLSPDTALG